MPFQKGNNANPTGRPKKTKEQIDFEKWCQEKAAKDGPAFLEAMLKDKNQRQWALGEIFNRGFGKSVNIEFSEQSIVGESKPSLEEVKQELASIEPGAVIESPILPNQTQGTA